MTRFKTALLSVLIFLPLMAGATIERSREYRYHLWVPDRCKTEWNKDLRPHLKSSAEDMTVSVDVFTAEEDEQFSYRTILKASVFSQPDIYYAQKAEPWYNLLRHSRIAIEKNDDGEFTVHRLDYRRKTFFWVKVQCGSLSLKDATDIVESFSSECNTNSYFKIMLSNLRWYLATPYLTFLPLFGSWASNYRKRWKRSAKKDKKALALMIASLVATLALLGFMVFCLQDCLPLALIVGIASVALWLCFFFKIDFIKNFFNGFFS